MSLSAQGGEAPTKIVNYSANDYAFLQPYIIAIHRHMENRKFFKSAHDARYLMSIVNLPTKFPAFLQPHFTHTGHAEIDDIDVSVPEAERLSTANPSNQQMIMPFYST